MNDLKWKRLGRVCCGALTLSLTAPALGQTAYFSLEGEVIVAGDQFDFFFDTSRRA